MAVGKKWTAMAAFVVAAGLALPGWTPVSAQRERDFRLARERDATLEREGGFKLEGAWIARVTSFTGVGEWPYITQWSYVIVPDPSGRRGSFHGSVDVPFPAANPAPPDVYATPILGEVIQTGPDTAVDNSIWYTIRKAPGVYQIVNIGTARGEWKWLGPGKIQTTVDFAIYLPSADTDKDGIPEADATPVASFTVTTLDTRVPLPR